MGNREQKAEKMAQSAFVHTGAIPSQERLSVGHGSRRRMQKSSLMKSPSGSSTIGTASNLRTTLPTNLVTVADVVFLYHTRAERAEITKKMDFYHLRPIVALIGTVPISELSRRHLQTFEDKQRDEGVKQNTIQRRLAILRAALNWCLEREFIPANPMTGYKLKRGQDQKFIPPTPVEVSQIIKHAPEHVVRAVILGYNIGMRIGPSELFSLTWEAFSLDTSPPVVIFRAASKNSNEPWRKVPIKEYILPLLRRWCAEGHLAAHPLVYSLQG